MRKLATVLMALALGAAAAEQACAGVWVTGYYPGWTQKRLNPKDIDFGAVTHLVHFSVVPRPDGSLDSTVNMMTPANVRAAVSAAHAAGKKILFTVGGQNSRAQFVAAMREERLSAFVGSLVQFLRDNGYDGIDVDMEDIQPGDDRDYARFIRELRRRLDALTPRPLLTAAVLWRPGLFAQLAGEFDQINLMTYNLSGPYPGWVVWHSGPLYSGGHRFPSRPVRLPSADGLVELFLAAGVPRSKLGVGMSFNGYVWSGGAVSRPRQQWRTPPSIKNIPYYALAQTYRIEGSGLGYHWDESAQAAYLSIEGETSDDSQFVSFTDRAAAGKIIQYARRKGLGGVIVWDIGAGYCADQPPGRRDPLLQAVKRARLHSQEGSL